MLLLIFCSQKTGSVEILHIFVYALSYLALKTTGLQHGFSFVVMQTVAEMSAIYITVVYI